MSKDEFLDGATLMVAAIVGAIFAIIGLVATSTVITEYNQDTECQKKMPDKRVEYIDDQCHYATELGWIREDKVISKEKVQ